MFWGKTRPKKNEDKLANDGNVLDIVKNTSFINQDEFLNNAKNVYIYNNYLIAFVNYGKKSYKKENYMIKYIFYL